MLFAKSKSKFHYQTRYESYLKLACLVVVIVIPLAFLQVFLQRANTKSSGGSGNKNQPHDEALQVLEILRHNSSNKHQPLQIHTRSGGLPYKMPVYLAPTINSGQKLDASYDGKVGELFDINRSQDRMSILRVRRSSPTLDTTENQLESPPFNSGQGHPGGGQNNGHYNGHHDGSLEAQNHKEHDLSAQGGESSGSQEQPVLGAGSVSGHVNTNDNDKKPIMVLVRSKSGQLGETTLPLDDLIVMPANEAQMDSSTPTNESIGSTNSHSNNSAAYGLGEESASGPETSDVVIPSLAQLTAAGTRAGLLLSDLAAKAADGGGSYNPYMNDEANTFEGEAENPHVNVYAKDQPAFSAPQNGQELLEARLAAASSAGQMGTSRQLEEPASANELSDDSGLPDSMESLMNSETDDIEGPRDRQDSAESPGGNNLQEIVAANPSTLSPINEEADDDGDGGDDDNEIEVNQHQANNYHPLSNQVLTQALSATQMPTNSLPIQYHTPMVSNNQLAHHLHNPFPVVSFDEQQLASPLRNSLEDLNTAAGHYHGKKKKKKKKKVVIKKKKKIIVKKKKKKVKVTKYKVKKIKIVKKKKKKPKKKHHHHDHGKYYMYAKVPKKKSWEFGFKKGNKKHWIERHEKGHKNKFKTKVKWFDKKSKGKGIHIWDYNHHDKKKKHH